MSEPRDYQKLFKDCFPFATHPRTHVSAGAYNIFTNYVYLPRPDDPSDSVYRFLHEYAHAQLNNGVMGLTCMTVFNILSYFVESVVYDSYAPVLEALRLSGQEQASKLHRAWVVGDPAQIDCWSDADLSRVFSSEELRERLFDVASSEQAAEHREILLRYMGRCGDIRDAWCLVHEGLATFAQTQWSTCSFVAPEEQDMVGRAVRFIYGEDSSEVDVQAVREDVAEYGREAQDEYRSGRGDPVVVEGYVLCSRLADALGEPGAAWVAAFAASHFPYPCCDFVDMSDDEWSLWLSGAWNFTGRLKHALGAPTTLRGLWDREDVDAAMGEYLQSFPTQADLRPLPRAGSTFGNWDREYLWNAKAFWPVIGRRVATPEMGEWVAEDKSNNFKHGPRFDPPTVLSNGRVVAPNEAAKRFCERAFVCKYELERTMRLSDAVDRCVKLVAS